MGSSQSSQKILLYTGNGLSVLGTLAVLSAWIGSYEKNEHAITIGGILLMLGVMLAISSIYYKQKPINVLSCILYSLLALCITILGSYDNNKHISSLGAILQVLVLIEINFLVYQPKDLRVFKVINIILSVIGFILIWAGYVDQGVNSKQYAIIGGSILGLSSIMTNVMHF